MKHYWRWHLLIVSPDSRLYTLCQIHIFCDLHQNSKCYCYSASHESYQTDCLATSYKSSTGSADSNWCISDEHFSMIQWHSNQKPMIFFYWRWTWYHPDIYTPLFLELKKAEYKGFHMGYIFFPYYDWLFQNLEKGWSFLLCQFVFIAVKIRQKTLIYLGRYVRNSDQ